MTMMLFDDRSLPQNKSGIISKLTDAQIAAKFLEFWGIFPKRVGNNPKFKAERKFALLIKSGDNCETIIAGARRFAAECQSNGTAGRFVPMAITWLNGKMWLNDPDAGPGGQPKSMIEIAREWRERADDHDEDRHGCAGQGIGQRDEARAWPVGPRAVALQR